MFGGLCERRWIYDRVEHTQRDEQNREMHIPVHVLHFGDRMDRHHSIEDTLSGGADSMVDGMNKSYRTVVFYLDNTIEEED